MKKKRESKKGKDNTKIIVSVFVVLILFVGGFFLFSSGDNYSRESVDTFANCLTEKGAVMYGAFWCPHCAKTKKNFGSSFKFINYVECDPRGDNEQSELCLSKEIEKYDTWEFTDGSRVIGEPSFEVLSEKTGCRIPV
ncbi:MAG: hypothetical protein IH845_01345 [Nanoarchaeota archaeon]|nr:hypothetical protein [Nanoarchaeota archaeon]